MPTYYHIHRGLEPSDLENGFIDIDEEYNNILFIAKENTFWHNMERSISKNYGGYSEFTITFPYKLFTESFNPRTPKIIKITKNNIKTYKKHFKTRDSVYNYILRNSNILGMDFTYITNRGMNWLFSNECIIIRKNKNIKIKLNIYNKLNYNNF